MKVVDTTQTATTIATADVIRVLSVRRKTVAPRSTLHRSRKTQKLDLSQGTSIDSTLTFATLINDSTLRTSSTSLRSKVTLTTILKTNLVTLLKLF